MRWTDRRSDRGQSVPLGYALSIGITTLLVIALVFTAGGYVEDQRERVVRTELGVVGQQLASDVSAADRLVRAGSTEFAVARDAPETVAGVTYTVSMETGSDPDDDTFLRLSTSDPDVTVEVDMALRTPIEEGAVSGGEIRITYDQTLSPSALVIESV